MVVGRDTIIGMGVGAPALRAGGAERNRAPDPEVVAKPTRRQAKRGSLKAQIAGCRLTALRHQHLYSRAAARKSSF